MENNMKFRAYLGADLFAYKNMTPEEFKKATLEYKNFLYIKDMDNVVLLILPHATKPDIISRAVGIERKDANKTMISWVYKLKLPPWIY